LTTETTTIPTETTPTGSTPTEVTSKEGCDALRHAEGPVVISTQTELDAFCPLYNAVDGDFALELGAPKDFITELDGVACLCEVTGTVEISYTASGAAPPPHASADLELDHLTTVGGDLNIHDIPGLSDLYGLVELEEVGGDMLLVGNYKLRGIGLPALRGVGGTLQISGSTELAEVAFSGLTEVGALVIDDTWLPVLTHVDFSALERADGALQMIGVPLLAQIDLPGLTTVGGTLQVAGSCGLGLDAPALTSAGGLQLRGLCELPDLDGFGALAEITGAGLGISHNDLLEDAELDAFVEGLIVSGDTELISGEDSRCADYWQDTWGRSTTSCPP